MEPSPRRSAPIWKKDSYYKGVRFDPSGIILSLKCGKHSYFGNRFAEHIPTLHDSISGPVEEYRAIGYDEAKVGETFLKIGVGELVKVCEGPYDFKQYYQIKNRGKLDC